MDKYLTGIKVPHWVRWIAVDGDGDTRGFRTKPFTNKFIDVWNVASSFERSEFLHKDKPPKNWKEELYHWS